MEFSFILFKGIELPHVLDHHTKRSVFERILHLSGRRITDPMFRLLTKDQQFQEIQQTAEFYKETTNDGSSSKFRPVVLTTVTRGERAWLFFTKMFGIPQIFLIPKYMKPGYPYPRFIIFTNYLEVTTDIFGDTLFETEIFFPYQNNNVGNPKISSEIDAPANKDQLYQFHCLQVRQQQQQLQLLQQQQLFILISDIVLMNGTRQLDENPLVRFTTIGKAARFSSNSLHDSENLVVVRVKRLFTVPQIRKMMKMSNEAGIPVKGFTIYECGGDPKLLPYLWIDDQEELFSMPRS